YLGANVLFRTVNGGRSWQTISPDLTRPTYDVPANLGAFAPLDPEAGKHRGVIYTIAPSFLRQNLIWAGTDDGLIHVTHDGARTRLDAHSSSPGRSGASTCRSTTVTTGSRCASTSRRPRSVTSWCTTATWSSPLMDAPSGSSTTSPPCARSPRPLGPAASICTARRSPCGCGGTRTRTRPSRPTSRRARTRPTAPCSTTTCRAPRRGGDQ